MASFGSFETVREVYSGPSYTVYSARRAGDSETEYAIKVFCLFPTALEAESASDLAPLIADIEQSCRQRIAVQQEAAAHSKFISPILETGHDDRGVWYATRFYPRSANKILSGRVALSRDALEHIVRAIAQGALDVKRTCGRSHGDIQPSNVQIGRSDSLVEAEVALSDPLPGDETEAARYELSDLRAIGRILLQFVLQRGFTEDEVLIPPFALSPEWTRLFRKDGERWLSLCNRLLDPNLSLEQLNLEKLGEELEQLRAKPPISRGMLLAAAAALVVLALAGMFALRYFNRADLLITTDPPGAEIKLVFEDKQTSLGKTPADGMPLKVRLRKGMHTLRAVYPGLQEQTAELLLQPRKTRDYQILFPYGRVKITSEPTGAAVKLEGQELGRTPYNSVLGPGRVILKVLSEGYEESEFNIQVPSDRQTITLHTNLVWVPPDNVYVTFTSKPSGAKIKVSTNDLCTADALGTRRSLPPGLHTITAQFEDWPPAVTNVNVRPGTSPSVDFYLPHGSLNVELKPEEAQVRVNEKTIGRTRVALRPGNHVLSVDHPGYEPFKTNLVIVEGKLTTLSLTLKALLGLVEFTTDPPGAAIFDVRAPFNELGRTRPGQPLPLSFQPGTYSFAAKYEGLDSVTNEPVHVSLGTNIVVRLPFKYGTVQFDGEPPEAKVLIGGQEAPRTYVQKPGPVSYRIELEDYEPQADTTTVAEGRIIKVPWRLQPRNVELQLQSEPGNAEFYVGETRLVGTNGVYKVPWGNHLIRATHPNLEPLTNLVYVDKRGNSSTNFVFDYATLQITNDEPEARLLYYDKPVGKLPVLLQLKPNFQYDFVLECVDFRTNLPIKLARREVSRPLIALPELRRSYTNSIGLVLVRVMGMPEYPNGFWVGRYEVTEGEYLKVIKGNPHAFDQTGIHPQVMVTPQNATDFCLKLTEMDKLAGKLPAGADHYTLPTERQWEYFVADATLTDSITSMQARRTKPEPANPATRGPNRFGLYDVRGNIWEMCTAPDRSFWMRGGAYDSVEVGFRPGLALKQRNPVPAFPSSVLGFRVVCISGTPGATAQK